MKTKLQSLGFTSGHVHLLLIAFAIFGILIMAKTDINFNTLFAQADDEQKMLTFEDVRDQALAQSTTLDTTLTQDEQDQLALLDRSLDNGQVLGEAVGIGSIPNAEELYSSEQMNSIPIQSTVVSNWQTVEQYANRLLRIESYYNTTEMFANLNSSDNQLIADTTTKAQAISNDMAKIPVPTDLVEYHRYKVMYYRALAAIGNTFTTQEGDLNNQTKVLFSLTNKITGIEGWVKNEYQIEL